MEDMIITISLSRIGLGKARRWREWLWGSVLLLMLAGLQGCNWIAVSYHALHYPSTAAGEHANVVVVGKSAYATLGEVGLEIVDMEDPQRRAIIAPPMGSGSIDDVAATDGFLFVLDARDPGYLSVLSLSDPSLPVMVSGPVEVPVGPFSGVSAGNGNVVVSGGTSSLTLFHYDSLGRLTPEVARTDLGRGQPDVLLSPDGKTAFVSTHYFGPYFGLTILELGNDPFPFIRDTDIELETYGFTAGGAKPANFPIEAALSGNVAFVAHDKGLAIISVEVPSQPVLRGVIDLGVSAVNVDAAGNVAAVVGSAPRPLLVLLDVGNPREPVIKQSVSLPEASYPVSVALGEAHVVVATRKHGLLIYQHQQWSLRPERSYK